MKLSAAGIDVKIKVVSREDGHALTDAEIGSGFTFIYYVYPSSKEQQYANLSYLDFLAALKNDGYRHEKKVMSADQSFTIEKPDGVTESCYVRGGIHVDEDDDDAYSLNMWDGTFYASYGNTLSSEGLTVDGRHGGRDIKDEEKIKNVNDEYQFTFRKYAEFQAPVSFHTTVKKGIDADFPFYLKVSAESTTDPAMKYSDVIKVENNGEFDIKFEDLPFFHEKTDTASYHFTVKAYADEALTQELEEWNCTELDTDVTFADNTGGQQEQELVYEKDNTGFAETLKIPFITNLEETGDFFPAYMELKLYDTDDNLLTTYTRELNSLEDANKTIEISGKFAVDNPYKAEWKIYKSDKTTVHDKWNSGSMDVWLNKNKKLMANDYNGNQAAFSIVYNKMKPKIRTIIKHPGIELTDKPHTYFKIMAFDDPYPYGEEGSYIHWYSIEEIGQMENAVATKVLETKPEDAGKKLTVDMDYLGWSGKEYFIFAIPYINEECQGIDNGWLRYNYGETVNIAKNGILTYPWSDSELLMDLTWNGFEIKFPAHVTYKEGVDLSPLKNRWTWTNISRYCVCYDFDLYRYENGNYTHIDGDQIYSYGSYHYSGEAFSRSIANFIPADEDGHHFGTFEMNLGYLTPGEYYLCWYNETVRSTWGFPVNYIDRNKNWTGENEVKVIVGEDGSFKFEDGTDVETTITYLGNNPEEEGWVTPVLNIDTKLQGNITENNSNLYVQIYGAEESNRTAHWWAWIGDKCTSDYSITGNLQEINADSNYRVGITADGRDGVNIISGIGTNASLIAIKPGKYTVTYYDNYNENGWVKEENIDVEFKLDEDGKGRLYRLDDGKELVIKHHQLPKLDSVKLKVDTIVNEGVQNAFTEGDKLTVTLHRGQVYSDGRTNVSPVATGEMALTEAGESEVTLTPIEGEFIVPGTRDDIKVSGDENEATGYALETKVVHADGTTNSLWSWYYDRAVVTADGYVQPTTSQSSGYNDNVTTDKYINRSYLIPYKINSGKPEEVTSSGDISFKPVTDLSQIVNKGHYIIAVQGPDDKWYAVFADEKSGDRAILKDFDPEDVKENGYKVEEGNLSSSGYVFTASKTTYGENTVNVQLKTGKQNVAGKQMGLKFGSSSTEVRPLFDGSPGTLTVTNVGEASDGFNHFTFWKNTYAEMIYISEWFGFQGYDVFGTKYMKNEIASRENIDGTDYTVLTLPSSSSYDTTSYRFINSKPVSTLNENQDYRNAFVYEMPKEYATEQYFNTLQGSEDYKSKNDSTIRDFIILSDNTKVDETIMNNEYKLVKTMGDFVNTFMNQSLNNKEMVLVYTDEDGKEYALNPKGLVQVKTAEQAADYRKLTAGSDNEVIANNESRDYEGNVVFGFQTVDYDGTGKLAFATGYSFRKSRVNSYNDGEYLTLGEKTWDSDDAVHDDSVAYVLYPTATAYSVADYNVRASYKLATYKNGEESWLGVKDGKMVTVSSEAEAVTFDIYAPNVARFYPDASTTEYFPYYKISSLKDITEDDEIIIVYDKGDTSEVLTNSISDYYSYQYYVTTPWVSQGTDAEAPYNSPKTFNIDSEVFEQDYGFIYRMNSDDREKKAFAYYPYKDDDRMIMSQALVAHIIGDYKSESGEKQKKFYSLDSIMSDYYGGKLTLKADGKALYRNSNAEVNFIYENGQFYLRGGKSDAWLGSDTYLRSGGPWYLRETSSHIEDRYIDYFTVVGTDKRIPIKIYKRGSLNTIQIKYHDHDGSVETETKSEGIISLPQYDDIKKNNEDYVFVGWTKDESKAGLLSMDDSANLYDFDDVSRVASVKESVAKKYGLIGNCNPEKTNTAKVMASDLTDGVLDLYAVYAMRGCSIPVTANDGDTMIMGISDFKDIQEGGDGTFDERERWLGSINIEIYKDGALWVPSAAVNPGSVSPNSVIKPAANGKSATMYFAYHNDDAADLNIKFIAETVTEATLQEYLSSNKFETAEPTEQYVIDAVYAEQGGSEDGLKYKYNWLDDVVGGQLDNVKGGSTVKVYVTSKYQVKYYFDDGDGNGYEELTDDAHQNKNYYTTPGTEKVVAANTENADYVVMNKDENEYKDLIRKTPQNSDTFSDENIRRGDYSYFQYKFNDTVHVIPIAALPDAPDGMELASDQWTVRDKDKKKVASVQPESDLAVTETTYGTGNSKWSYLDEALNDNTNTYHLYIKVKSNEQTGSLKVQKTVEGIRDAQNEFAFTVTLSDSDVSGTYGDMEFSDGVAKFTLKDGESKTAEDLPANVTYEVTEEKAEGYETTSEGETGTIEADDTAEVAFVNTLITKDIVVTKEWDDKDNALKSRPESITVHLVADGEEVDSREIKPDDNGDWKAEFNDLPAYKEADGKMEEIVYTVEEDDVAGYHRKVDNDSFTITNTADLGRIVVTKIVRNDGEDVSIDATFYAALFKENEDGEKVICSDIQAIEMHSDSSDPATVTFEDVPYGTYYVQEVDQDGIPFNGYSEELDIQFDVSVSPEKVELNEETKIAQATIVNDYTTPGTLDTDLYGDLYVTKVTTVEGEDSTDTDEVFYAGLFLDETGETPYTDEDGSAVMVELDVQNGKAATAAFHNVPYGTYYIFETDENGDKVDSLFWSGKNIPWNVSYQKDNQKVDTPVVSIDSDSKTESITILNNNLIPPDEETKVKSIQVLKKLTEDGKVTKLTGDFYAAAFSDPEGNDRVSDVYTLSVKDGKMEKPATINVPDYGTYYILEVNKDGSKFTGHHDGLDLDFKVSYDKQEIVLTEERFIGAVTITNDHQTDEPDNPVLPDEPDTPEEPDLPEIPDEPKDAPSTGDHGNTVLYAVFGSAAGLAVCAAAILLIRRKR